MKVAMVFAPHSAHYCRFLPPFFLSSEVAETLDSSNLRALWRVSSLPVPADSIAPASILNLRSV